MLSSTRSYRTATDIPSVQETDNVDRATTGVPIEEMELYPEEVDSSRHKRKN